MSDKWPGVPFSADFSFGLEVKVQPVQPRTLMAFAESIEYAFYLPDMMAFVAKNNAFSEGQFKDVYIINVTLMMMAVGFFHYTTSDMPGNM